MTPDPTGYPREAPFMRVLRETVPTKAPAHWSYDPTRRVKRIADSRSQIAIRSALAEFEQFLAAQAGK
jgi:hypothetical protein